jgi:hypothetical protein
MKLLFPRRRFFLGSMAVVIAVMVAIPKQKSAEGSIAVALDLAGLVELSDRIVVADVVSVKSAWDESHRTIFSTVELAVGESWKGSVSPTRRISIVQVGGKVDGVVMFVPGQSQFVPAERAVLFLRGPENAARVVGLGQGKRPLRFDSHARAWMVDGGDRSAAFHIDGKGRMTAAEAEPAVVLESLRQQVRRLVAK